MNATIPIELINLGLQGPFIKKGPHEIAGPCPNCGGKDRFIVWTDREYPHWNYICRTCKPEGGWLDQLFPELKDKNWKLSPQERARRAAEYAREREESLKREIERAQAVLHELQEARSWLRYHDQLNDYARALYENRGIPEFFQEFWKLGYEPDRMFLSNGETWHTPTLTIPIFEPGWNCINVRHRLLKTVNPGDKYRPDKAGLPASLFVADPDRPIEGKTLLVEGEFKSMVSFITIDDPTLQVVGIPGKKTSPALLAKLHDCDPVYICLDPDAQIESKEIASLLGKDRTRLIELPDKIDDLINDGSLDKYTLRNLMNTARRN